MTGLILAGHASIARGAKEAVVSINDPRSRLIEMARAIRRRAIKCPHEHALHCGAPVPDDQAPQEIILQAAQVAGAFASVRVDAHGDNPPPPLSRANIDPVIALVRVRLAHRDDGLIADGLRAFNSMFGVFSFEPFGHLAG